MIDLIGCGVGFKPAVRKSPHSSNYSLWQTERLATIVPNNRKIYDLLKSHQDFFDSSEQLILEKFFIHVRGYEAWVKEEVSYEGVVRFPQDFDTLIKELSNGIAK